MFLTIILVLTSLVALNFLLLIFSCNKSSRRSEIEPSTPTIIIQPKITNQQVSAQLAPTGS